MLTAVRKWDKVRFAFTCLLAAQAICIVVVFVILTTPKGPIDFQNRKQLCFQTIILNSSDPDIDLNCDVYFQSNFSQKSTQIPANFTDKELEELDWENLILERALENLVELKRKYLIVTVGNAGQYELLLNFMASMRATNHSHYLLISLDVDLFRRLAPWRNEFLSSHVALVPSSWLGFSALASGEAEWSSRDYNLLTMAKTLIVHRLLNFGFTVVFNDADIAWLSPNALGYIDEMWPIGAEFLFMLEADMSANTGFYVACPTATVRNLYAEAIRRHKNELTTNDQIVFNRAIARSDRRVEEFMRPLPPLFYVSGGVAPHLKSRYPGSRRPWVVHANYCVGKRCKFNLLRNIGAWFLNTTIE